MAMTPTETIQRRGDILYFFPVKSRYNQRLRSVKHKFIKLSHSNITATAVITLGF
jgi:hypothetical protein